MLQSGPVGLISSVNGRIICLEKRVPRETPDPYGLRGLILARSCLDHNLICRTALRNGGSGSLGAGRIISYILGGITFRQMAERCLKGNER